MTKPLGELIKAAREKAGLSVRKLAELSGVSRQYIGFLEAGQDHDVSIEKRLAIARVLNIPEQEILGLEDDRTKIVSIITDRVDAALAGFRVKETGEKYEPLDLVTIPLRGYVPAGIPVSTEEEKGETIEVPRQLLNGASLDQLFALKISGNSLSGDEIYSGDSVVVNPNEKNIVNGKIFIVRIGNEVAARHVYKKDDYLRLVSSNGDYKEIAATDVEILGKLMVSGRWKKH